MSLRKSPTKPMRNNIITPTEAYILLPETLIDENCNWSLLTSPCMSNMLWSGFDSMHDVFEYHLGFPIKPITWFTLMLQPQKLEAVVGAVIPVLSSIIDFPYGLCGQITSDQLKGRNIMFETSLETDKWDLKLLVNLQVIILLPWPDIYKQLLFSCDSEMTCSKKYQMKISDDQLSVRLGNICPNWHSRRRRLNEITTQNSTVYLVHDHFQQSTAELAITLVTSIGKNLLLDASKVYQHWLSSLSGHPNQWMSQSESGILSTAGNLQLSPGSFLSTNRCEVNLTSTPRSRNQVAQPSLSSQNVSYNVRLRETQSENSRLNMGNVCGSDLLYVRPPTDSLIDPADKQQRAGPHSLKGRTLGIIGLTSSTSQQIARVLSKGFYMNVVYYQNHPLPNVRYRYVDQLEVLLQESDFIVLSDDKFNQIIPSSEKPKKRCKSRVSLKQRRRPQFWLTADHFSMMKSSAYVVCVTSTQSIDFDSLMCSLRYGHLAGAAITLPKVWYTAYPNIKDFQGLHNALLLPPATSTACADLKIHRKVVQKTLTIILQNLSQSQKLSEGSIQSTQRMRNAKMIRYLTNSFNILKFWKGIHLQKTPTSSITTTVKSQDDTNTTELRT